MNAYLNQKYESEKEYMIAYKEYYLNEYYFKVGYNAGNQIIFIIYNIQLLDNIKYEIKINQNDFYNLNKIFKMYDNIKEIYEAILKLIEENNYKIENKNNELKLIINIRDMFKKNKDIEFILYKYYNNEYFGIICKEIIKIKNKEIKVLKYSNQNMNQEINELIKIIQI